MTTAHGLSSNKRSAMMTAKHYRRECPACDRWHDASEPCGDEPPAEIHKQRVVAAIGRYERKRDNRTRKV